jgi:hypothetical protein
MGSVEVGAVVPPDAEPCDFDADGDCDIDDIDELVMAISTGSTDPKYDLDMSGTVAAPGDINAWLAQAGALNTPCGNPYKPGDFNLDGFVDGTDFGIFNANKFTSTGMWSEGDANADGFTDGTDFGVFNANKFTSSCGPRPAGGDLDSLASEEQAEVLGAALASLGNSQKTNANRNRVGQAISETVATPVVAGHRQAEVSAVRKQASGNEVEIRKPIAPPAAVTAVYVDGRVFTQTAMHTARKDRVSVLDRVFSELGS